MKLSGNPTILSIVAIIAIVLTAGCSQSPQHVLGSAAGMAQPIAVQSLVARNAGARVSVAGEMIEKCPVAGCWFILKDKTGVVRVDTKGAGFVVTDVPLHSHLIVTGAVTSGAQPGIDANGVRY